MRRSQESFLQVYLGNAGTKLVEWFSRRSTSSIGGPKRSPTPGPASLAPLRFPPAAEPRVNVPPPCAHAPAASLFPLHSPARRTQVRRAPAESSATSTRVSGFPRQFGSSPA